jgi:hypothetical protein
VRAPPIAGDGQQENNRQRGDRRKACVRDRASAC